MEAQAGDGNVFHVKYALNSDQHVFFSFWATGYTEQADRYRFHNAKVQRTDSLELDSGAQSFGYPIQPHDLDRRNTTIYCYRVKKPEWFDREPPNGVNPVEDATVQTECEESPERQAHLSAAAAYEDFTLNMRHG